jgi:hypothetical protein
MTSCAIGLVIDVQSTTHQAIHFGLCTYRYFKGISTNIELQVYGCAVCMYVCMVGKGTQVILLAKRSAL